MMAGSNCDCLVCRTERCLIAELREECASKELARARNSSSVLTVYDSPLDLVRALHTPEDPTGSGSSDALLSELLLENTRASAGSIWQRLLLLVFVPTIHRTTSHIAAAFPSLAREDVSQYVVSVFLDFLLSRELRARRSHLAFTIARKLRRRAFRWAIHEARLAVPDETDARWSADSNDRELLDAEVTLARFLDNCQRAGWLSRDERQLLVDFKLDGISSSELARRNGHSSVAIRHRAQRILARLRRLAQKAPPHQFRLFPPWQQKKIF